MLLGRTVVALLALTTTAPAAAAEYLITYSGHVLSGMDNAGAFGTPGADLAGTDFQVAFTMLYPFPAVSDARFVDGGDYQTVWSGSIVSAPPALSATVTIDGRSVSLSGGYYGYASYQNDYRIDDDGTAWDSVTHLAYGEDRLSSVYSSIGNFSDDMLSTPSIAARTSYSVQAGDSHTGRFRTAILQNGSYRFTDLVFEPMAFTAGPAPGAPGVPEPSAWLMMLSGFGATGAVLRRTRRSRSPTCRGLNSRVTLSRERFALRSC